MNSYNNWIKKIVSGESGESLTSGTFYTPGDPQDYKPITFHTLDREWYVGEVAKKGNDYIYHFYPKGDHRLFEQKMEDTFLFVFKNANQVQSAWSDELNSWAVKVTGFGNTIWGDTQAESIFSILDNALQTI